MEASVGSWACKGLGDAASLYPLCFVLVHLRSGFDYVTLSPKFDPAALNNG